MKKDTTPLYIISRNFVEFGPFTALEISGFRQRGVLSDHDYVRCAEGHDWLPLGVWLTTVGSGLTGTKPAAKARTPAARKRATPAAKASKKAA